MSHAAVPWQLRVLSGWHEGACVDLAGEAGALTLGTDVQSDVVLRDAPFAQAHLHWDAQDCRLAHDGSTLTLAAGQALAWQDLHLAVDRPNAPWAYAQHLAWPQPAPSTPEAPPLDTDRPTAPGDEQPAEHSEVQPPSMAAAPTSAPWRQRMRQQRTWRLGLVGLGSLLAVAAVSAWTQWQGRAPTPLPRLVATEVSATPEISPEQLQAVLRRAGLDQSVRVEKADGQRHALWGVVQDQDQLEALLRGVMALSLIHISEPTRH